MTQSPGKLLRTAAAKSTLAVPGAFSALVGRMVERAGFKATYLSGGAFSAGALAMPDVGLFTLTELADQTARLTRRVEIPVIVDADTGFGGIMQVERTIVELENAGPTRRSDPDQALRSSVGQDAGRNRRNVRQAAGRGSQSP